jgi:hypothetical protein
MLDESYDLAIVTYELVALRTMPFWKDVAERVINLVERATIRVVMPQDDYTCCEILDSFVIRSGAQFVFTPLTRDLNLLYPKSLKAGVQFFEAFTGYWESSTTLPYMAFQVPFEQRTIDLGQRVRHLPPQFGADAQRKGELATKFADLAMIENFVCDVSTKDSDVLVGDAWWKFLGNSRFTVGRLGGASIADPRGRLAAKVQQLQLRNPKITLEELAKRLETNSFPHGDFSAISPRLFECAAMGVCQILEEARYFDEFKPWIHYIPISENLTNLKEVFEVMRDWERCQEIVHASQESLLQSGRYSYSTFVRRLVKSTTGFEIDSDIASRVIDADERLFGDLDAAQIAEVKSLVRVKIIRNSKLDSKSENQYLSKWFNAFKKKDLIVESLTMPWSSAITHLAHS